MAVTDICTLLLSLLFLNQGASRGFILSLLGPFSIIVGTIASIVYYKMTGNITASLIIGVIGPIFLSLILKVIFKVWLTATKTEVRPDFLSRLGGALLTLVWGWVFIFFILILLTVMPAWDENLTKVHNDVMKSMSYAMVKPLEDVFFGRIKEIGPAPGSIASASSNSDVQQLAQDPRFQKILQDPEIQQEIQAHDFAGLMKNPMMLQLVQQIMSDPQAMKKVMAVYNSQIQTK